MKKPYVKPVSLECRRHPELGLWCRQDGKVFIPENGSRKAHWTYGSPRGNGYLGVRFHGKTYSVHRLIAGAFIPNPLNLPTVDHVNRDKADNRADNLRYASRKVQQNNRQMCEDSLAKYGVRYCEDVNAYARALYANNPEYAERQRINVREWREKQRALGRRCRKCPDGKEHWLTDEEYDEQFGNDPQQIRLF